MSCAIHGPCPICQAQKFLGDPRKGVQGPVIPFTHWSKDPLIPYRDCRCSSCEYARGDLVLTTTPNTEAGPK
jgi:hypothetical protein